MKIFDSKKDCCGCGACAAVCPSGAVSMKADEEGFLYPSVDDDMCADCGQCREICPQIKDSDDDFHDEPRFYVAHNKNEDVIKSSASGGAFSALSDIVLRRSGCVYGVIFDEKYGAMHYRAVTEDERNRMRGSKYIQSRMGDVYDQVKRDVEDGRTVLFTGTPCQTAGLRAFLGRDYDNVILCDLICHSIASPLIWSEYLRLLENEHNGRISYVNFRDKTDGWQRASTLKGFGYAIDNGSILKDDRFYKLFFKWKLIARPSCSQCRYARVRRVSDITIADYWGVERFAPQWADYYGVSLVMTSTPKGEQLLSESSSELDYEQREPWEQLEENHRLRGPMGIPEDERAVFWKDYTEKGFEQALQLAVQHYEGR